MLLGFKVVAQGSSTFGYFIFLHKEEDELINSFDLEFGTVILASTTQDCEY